jgi:uncharacterized protein (TIGR02391 family)
MLDALSSFQRIARSTTLFAYAEKPSREPEHPFEIRNIHALLPSDVRTLFDDGHYSQSTFESFKFVDKEIARLAGSMESGFKLMMAVLSESNPIVRFTPCVTVTEKDEQKGFQFLVAGSMMAIRNPRGHNYSVHDSPDECLDHLGIASTLLRRIESAGYVLNA